MNVTNYHAAHSAFNGPISSDKFKATTLNYTTRIFPTCIVTYSLSMCLDRLWTWTGFVVSPKETFYKTKKELWQDNRLFFLLEECFQNQHCSTTSQVALCQRISKWLYSTSPFAYSSTPTTSSPTLLEKKLLVSTTTTSNLTSKQPRRNVVRSSDAAAQRM